MTKCFVASTLANDPHTEGLHNAAKIAALANIRSVLLKPSLDLEALCQAIKEYSPDYLGLSYRLSPQVGCRELEKTLYYFRNTGLIKSDTRIKIWFAGLPETISMLRDRLAVLPLSVLLCEPYPNALDRVKETVDLFDIGEGREIIIERLREEIEPKGIKIFDHLADEVIANDGYKTEPPLRIPSLQARLSYTRRIQESGIPLLRSHFGIPSDTIEPTVEGIKTLAEARVLDEISLGSSDLSQRYFGHPEMFAGRKNDGGVPYKTNGDLERLYEASRCGNYPSMKPYCHVTDIVGFIHSCLKAGMLKGAHQAIPLFWFNELDGRGPMTVRESIKEHFAGVRELAKLGIPVEMNDPNQWSSRLAHDTIIVTSYALISAVMSMCGVSDMVLQMQFNKPKETGDYADLAKMFAGLNIATEVSRVRSVPAGIYRETRTGIESLSPDMEKAKWQLARSTLLQMCMNPHIIHIVSYCEANYAARPEDIIDSSKLIRKAVKIFRENEQDIKTAIDNPVIKDRVSYLQGECEYLLNKIAALHPSYQSVPVEKLAKYLGDEDVLATAMEKHIISAPGIINLTYKGSFMTKPMKYGMINLVNNYEVPSVIREAERLAF